MEALRNFVLVKTDSVRPAVCSVASRASAQVPSWGRFRADCGQECKELVYAGWAHIIADNVRYLGRQVNEQVLVITWLT